MTKPGPDHNAALVKIKCERCGKAARGDVKGPCKKCGCETAVYR